MRTREQGREEGEEVKSMPPKATRKRRRRSLKCEDHTARYSFTRIHRPAPPHSRLVRHPVAVALLKPKTTGTTQLVKSQTAVVTVVFFFFLLLLALFYCGRSAGKGEGAGIFASAATTAAIRDCADTLAGQSKSTCGIRDCK
ncbi:hypothetical protein TcWFU_004226 [Taenia crassiceps]|uniref:Uncharacterized protein n=1 Tax=Taenia crassiceps TaxID=6207 RepID=A0ABR4Q2V3_9CEST